MQMTKDISKDTMWNKFLMLTNYYETKDNDEENSNYNHSQVFTNNQSNEEIWPVTGDEMRYTQRSDSVGNTFFKQKDPKRKTCLVIIDETEYWHMTSWEL